MKRTSLLASVALAVATTAFSIGTAMAVQATTSLNVRSGPGTAYGVVDVLRAGEQVRVLQCRATGWCQISHGGPNGWVSARYLTDDDVRTIPSRPGPNVSFSFSFGRGDGFSIGGPPQGGPRDLVCLVTFFRANQVAAGRDADVRSARVMPRQQAERLDRPNDRRAIFDYGTNRQTRETCRYLDRLN